MARIRDASALVLSITTLAGSARAGGTPENALVVIDPTSAVSMQVGQHYINTRNIPESNVLYLRSAATNYAEFVNVQQRAMTALIAQRGLADHIDYIVIAPCDAFFVAAPGLIADECSPLTRLSISTAYASTPFAQTILAGTSLDLANGYFATSDTTLYFDSNNGHTNGLPTNNPAARRMYIGALLGWTGNAGNTPQEIMTMIDRSVAVDGTRPAGSFYYMNNTADTARNVRSTGFAAAISGINSRGGTAAQLSGVLPLNRTNVLGIMTGASDLTFTGAGITILPGAFADHLTSYGAAFDVSAQTKITRWIAEGCSGSAGTVEEPCNYLFKFPAPRLHTWYAQGMSLGEAYLRSMSAIPFQSLLLGDPLTRPFTHIPVVTVSGMPTAGSVVSGNLTFTPNATTTLPSGSIAAIDIHVDGVFRASIPRNTPFTLDTRTLADGHHEIRMIARDNSSTRSMGRLVSGFTTRNYFRSAGLNVASATGGVNTPFDFTPTASGGIVGGVRLLQNGRAIAAGNGLAPMRVYGSNLGAGSSRLRAEIHFADGRIARSEPIVVTVAPGAPVASGIPVAFSTTVVTPPGSTRLIELPAAFTGDPAGATFQTTAVPAGFTITPGTGPYRIVTAPANFSAPVTFSYTVQTSSGTSPVATISMRPSAPVPCIADFNTDGLLSPDDLDGFITAYFGDTPAERARCDFNADGFIEPGDIDEYITAFFSGC